MGDREAKILIALGIALCLTSLALGAALKLKEEARMARLRQQNWENFHER